MSLLLLLVTAGCDAILSPVVGQAQAAVHPTEAASDTATTATPEPSAEIDHVVLAAGAAMPPTEAPEPTATPSARISTPLVTPTATMTGATPTPRATSTPHTIPPGVTPAPFNGGQTVRGNPKTQVIALTFDSEGSEVGKLGDILDALKQNDMQATFFLLGVWAERNPQWVRRMIDEGHEVGTHSNTHPDLTKLSDAQVLSEIRKSEASIERASGGRKMPRLLRAPFGAANSRTLALTASQGYETIKWNVDPEDWRDSSTIGDIIRNVGQRASPGDIVVMHLHVRKTADAMPAILESYKARGVRSGTISQVLGRKP